MATRIETLRLRQRVIQRRMLIGFERNFAIQEMRVLTHQYNVAAKEFEANRYFNEGTFFYQSEWEQRRLLEKLYLPIMTAFVRNAETMLGSVRASVDDLISDYVDKQALRSASSITGTVVDKVRKVIAEGEASAQSVTQIGRNIQKLSGLTRPQAARIARTETHSASMFAQDAYAESTGLNPIREWLTTLDGRERISHDVANGQQREVGEPFDIDGYDLMYPGDPAGPPEEIINCRCGLLFRRREPEDEFASV